MNHDERFHTFTIDFYNQIAIDQFIVDKCYLRFCFMLYASRAFHRFREFVYTRNDLRPRNCISIIRHNMIYNAYYPSYDILVKSIAPRRKMLLGFFSYMHRAPFTDLIKYFLCETTCNHGIASFA